MKKISLFTIFLFCSVLLWGQRIPDWKTGVSIGLMEPDLQQTFKYMKSAGIEYLEVGLPKFKKVDAADIVQKVIEYKKFADEAGMTIWSVHIPFGWDYDLSTPDPVLQERCRQYILFSLELAKGLGKYEKAILHTSFEPIEPEKRNDHIIALRSALKELGPLVEKDYQVRLAVEDLPRTCLGNSSAEMLQILGDNLSVDVCFDVNHLLGEKSEHFGQKLGDRIKTVHMSDYDEENERHWLPGKGVINWNGVVDALVKSGYEGPFMFEVTKTPWKGDMKQFALDLAASWHKIRNDYAQYIKQ